MNYYQTLGIAPGSTVEQIKKAYKKKVMEHHPDRGGDPEKFKQVKEAYEELTKPKHSSRAQTETNNFSDIFSQFNGFQRQRARARLLLWIDLEDLIDPTPKIVAVQGRNSDVINIEISIPPGIEDGDTVSYPRVTPDNNDVLITFRIRPHSQFTREGKNLVKTLKISVWDLILGSTASIYNLIGSEIKVTIPPGTQPGTFLRVKGQGLPSRDGTAKGDILLQVNTHIPNHISPELIDQIKKHK